MRRIMFAVLLPSLVFAAGCAGEDEGEVIPEGVSVEPRDEVGVTGGVALPGNVTIDSAAIGDSITPTGADTLSQGMNGGT